MLVSEILYFEVFHLLGAVKTFFFLGIELLERYEREWGAGVYRLGIKLALCSFQVRF